MSLKVRQRLFSEDFPKLEELAKADDDAFVELAKKKILSPKKYYPFSNKRGRINANLTPTARKKRKTIYKIKNTKTGRSYTGKTAQKFANRVHGHHYGINNPERDVGQSDIYKEIRANPDQFRIGIQLNQKGTGVSLEFLERVCIIANDSFEKGYNKDRGGGGGTAATPPSTPSKTPTLTKEQAKTPVKGYHLDYDEKGNIKVLISPLAKKIKGGVYGFKNQVTGEWLVGVTEQEIGRRLAGYHFDFNHPRKDSGKRPLPSAVRLGPEDFRFYILDQRADRQLLKNLEKAWIKAKDALESGYNQNKGGGGSSAL